MRTPLWVLAGLGVLGVGLVGGYYLALGLQGQSQTLLAGAVVLAFLAWLGSGADLLGLIHEVLKGRTEKEEKRRQKLRKHTEILNEQVYKRLHVFVRSGRFGKTLELSIPSDNEEYNRWRMQFILKPLSYLEGVPDPALTPIGRLPFLERGISHLEAYQKIHEPWTSLQNLLQEYSTLVEALDKELIPTIRRQMRERLPPTFQDGDSGTTTVSLVDNVYYSDPIARFIIQQVVLATSQNRQPSFENSLDKWKEKHEQRWNIRAREGLLMLVYSVTEIDLETLQQILLAITREGTIMNRIQRLSQVEAEVYQSNAEFNANLKELITDIEDPENDFMLDGKCNRCEPWNK